jgi:carbon storage regulator CsrA
VTSFTGNNLRIMFQGGAVMLVLSRRPGQKVLFPGLGISIEVMRSQGAVTRLGIEAPDDVQILREEVWERSPEVSSEMTAVAFSPTERQQRHELKNRLNQLTLKLQLLQKQLELGRAINPDTQLADVFAGLSDLEQATSDSRPKDRPPRVLIVEDQTNERELLADCLRLSGIEVAAVQNGREAFDYLHEHEMPDLTLLDMRMPELDGPSLLKLIRDDIRLHDLRVFAVSGSARDEFSSSLPVDGWFAKPVRIDSLLRAVREQKQLSSTMV